jgi:hypothetical protein
MKIRMRLSRWLGFLALFFSVSAQAHLMMAQKGTLNLQGDGAYLVVSLPISAFEGVDEDKDGRWSESELDRHTPALREQLSRRIELRDARGLRDQQGLTLVPTPMDDRHDAPITQLVVMVKFDLSGILSPDSAQPASGLRFRIDLFGTQPDERQLSIAVTQGAHKHRLVVRPGHEAQVLFPGGWQVFRDALALGVEHILLGWDHLLFLAVVLLSGGTGRQILLVLSAFTVGHALTLAWASRGPGFLNPAPIEASIAATIVIMASLEWWMRRHCLTMPMPIRLTLVFACALVHGLGLASGLLAMELEPAHRLWSLLGFNLGIELAQCVIALGLILTASLVTRQLHARQVGQIRNALSAMAIAIGAFGLVERLS